MTESSGRRLMQTMIRRAPGARLRGSSVDCDRAASIELREPDDLYDRAWALSRNCDRKDLAIEKLTRAIELVPGWADAYLIRAFQHAYRGDFARALPDFDRCVRHADAWPNCYYNRLQAYQRLGRFEEALRDSDRLIELTPRSDEAYQLRAEVLVALGRIDDALADHDRALSVASSKALALAYRAGVLLFKDGNCGRAEEDVRRALELDPENPEIESAVAWVHLFGFYYTCPESYDLDSTLERARRGVELEPNYENRRSLLGAALLRSGRFEEAIEHQERAAAAYAGAAFDTYLLAMEHWQLGRHGQAREYYDDAAAWMDEHSPDDPYLILLRAEATELMGAR
jgi:tetratricopeptide (TPR) repeat protein